MPYRLLSLLIAACVLATGLTGCKENKLHPHTVAKREGKTPQVVPAKIVDAPATLASALANKYREAIAVTVVASMPMHGYTWLRVKDDSREGWVAAPMLRVPDNAAIELSDYAPSQEIDPDVVPGHIHTVLFVAAVRGARVQLIQTGEHAAVDPMLPAGGVTETDLNVELPSIAKADHDIGELFLRRDELNGRMIAIRAQVVRIAPSITGRNFAFLRDGSGDAFSSILPVMLQTTAEPSEVLMVVGRFRVGRAFMFGGVHPVLLEHARVATGPTEAEELKLTIAAELATNATPIAVPDPPPEATDTTAEDTEEP